MSLALRALDYVINPNVRIRRRVEDGRAHWRIWAPVRGRPLEIHDVDLDRDGWVARALEASMSSDRDIETSSFTTAQAQDLRRLGLLVQADEISEHVVLSAPSIELRSPADDRPGPWSVRGTIHVEPPPRLASGGGPLHIERGGDELVWHLGGAAEAATPWACEPAAFAALKAIIAGRTPDPRWVRALEHYGLISHGASRQRDDALLSAARDELSRTGCCILRGVVHGAFIDRLDEYYQRRIREGWLVRGDAQSLRYVAHDDPASEVVHACIDPLAHELLGPRFAPTYSYFASYEPGAALPRHRDRAAAEVTVSLMVSHRSAGVACKSVSPWPLVIERPEGGEVIAHQAPGDIVVFFGRRMFHARPPQPEGVQCATLLLHYASAPA